MQPKYRCPLQVASVRGRYTEESNASLEALAASIVEKFLSDREELTHLDFLAKFDMALLKKLSSEHGKLATLVSMVQEHLRNFGVEKHPDAVGVARSIHVLSIQCRCYKNRTDYLERLH